MAMWRVDADEHAETGVTIYQLQQRVSAGTLGPDDRVAEGDGDFVLVRDEPRLASLLPEQAGLPPKEGETKSVVVAGVRLRVGPDGKPLPPSPEELVTMLSTDPGLLDPEPIKKVRGWLVMLAVMLGLASAMLLAIILFR